MNNESSSGNKNVGGVTDFKCSSCPKVFKSGQARSVHQNVRHGRRPLRTYRGKKLSDLHPVLAAALSHHDPDEYEKSKTLDKPPSDDCRPQQELDTIDYLAKWNSTWKVENHEVASSSVDRVPMDNSDDLNLELQLCSKNLD